MKMMSGFSARSDSAPRLVEDPRVRPVERTIGAFLRKLRNLKPDQVESILRHQRENNTRFGESAVELKLATDNDVLWALSQQFQYPYATDGEETSFNHELIIASDPFSDQAEVFRDIRSQLMLGVMSPEQPRRPLAVLSSDVGDGKTFFVANLAAAFSQLGARTLVIDADMRRPRLHQIFGVPGLVGLSTILSGRAETDVIHQVPELPSLYVLPVGAVPPNPVELLQRPAFSLLLQEFCSKFDHVIVDTPAATYGADARVLAAKCGAALVIGRRGRSRLDSIQTLVTQVVRGQARFGGVLINDH